MKKELENNFRNIVVNQIPLIDVRAPIEFEKGAFLTSVNIPIMDDEQRKLVGIKYKEEGNEEATKLGYQLVSEKDREQKTQQWIQFIENNPETMIYCFRGGSRSRISQEWIRERIPEGVTRLEGGYKAFRNFLIDTLEMKNCKMKPILLGGCTGCGKTILLKKLANVIDLEHIANHRGSSFGRKLQGQPSQINFENNLAFSLIQLEEKGFSHMILEDEGAHVGTNYLPLSTKAYLDEAGLVVMDVPLEKRIQVTLDEYVIEEQQAYINAFAGNVEIGMEQWKIYITESVKRLKKRYGEHRMNLMLKMIEDAYQNQLKTGNYEGHEAWLATMLRDYYDPMYQHQIKNRTKTVIFQGNEEEVYEYLLTKQ